MRRIWACRRRDSTSRSFEVARARRCPPTYLFRRPGPVQADFRTTRHAFSASPAPRPCRPARGCPDDLSRGHDLHHGRPAAGGRRPSAWFPGRLPPPGPDALRRPGGAARTTAGGFDLDTGPRPLMSWRMAASRAALTAVLFAPGLLWLSLTALAHLGPSPGWRRGRAAGRAAPRARRLDPRAGRTGRGQCRRWEFAGNRPLLPGGTCGRDRPARG